MKALSVVIPAYKAVDTIGITIQSILDSSIPSEVIVVEDGVFDELSTKLEKFNEVRLITKKINEGASAARNTGLDSVTTEYVLFLDADDYVDAVLLEDLVSSLDTENADLAFGPWAFDYPNIGVRTIHYPEDKDNEAHIVDWLKNKCTPDCSVMWRTESLRKIGAWDETFSNKDDSELVFRALMNDLVVATSQKGCGYYVQHSGEGRLSRLPMVQASHSAERILSKVSEWNKAYQSDEIEFGLGLYCYEHARRCYRAGERELGDLWFQRSREFGLKKHYGSKLHSFVANLMGLDKKERIASLRDRISFLSHKFD